MTVHTSLGVSTLQFVEQITVEIRLRGVLLIVVFCVYHILFRVDLNDTYCISFFPEISAFISPNSARVESYRLNASVGSGNNRPPGTEPSLQELRSRNPCVRWPHSHRPDS